MSNNAKDIADKLAAAFGGVDAFKPKAPPPPPPPPPRHQASSVDDFWSRPENDWRARATERLEKSKGYNNAPLGLIEGSKMPRHPKPNREPFRLVPGDYEELKEMHFDRSFTFDRFCQEACLPVLVEGHDPDYPAVARLYLARKKEVHQK